MGEREADFDAPMNEGRAKTMRMMRAAIALALVAAVSFAGGILAAGGAQTGSLAAISLFGGKLDATPDEDADLTAFWQAWNELDAAFVQTHASTTLPTRQERLWGAIAGLTASYGDPYTVFFPPEDAKVFQEDIAGNFGGTGMEIGIGPSGILTVIAPLKGTPSEAAGVHAGDQILSVAGKTTEGMPIDEAVKLIRGEPGTTVDFMMYRDGKSFPLTITRAVINVPTIDYGLDAKSGVFAISLYSFTATSPGLFADAIAAFQKSGSDKLLIDLRGNPGGYLDAAVDMASRFLPKGAVIVTEDYRGKKEADVSRSKGLGGVPDGTKVAILIDRGSASASEILAGALHDNQVATLIGTRSFGKGSVQQLVDIDGGSLKVTIARWLTPSGTSISDGGLTPDIAVDRSAEDAAAGRDLQKERAMQFLETGK